MFNEFRDKVFGVKCATCSHRKGGFFKRKCKCMKGDK